MPLQTAFIRWLKCFACWVNITVLHRLHYQCNIATWAKKAFSNQGACKYHWHLLLRAEQISHMWLSLNKIGDEAKQKSAYSILTECDSSDVYRRQQSVQKWKPFIQKFSSWWHRIKSCSICSNISPMCKKVLLKNGLTCLTRHLWF